MERKKTNTDWRKFILKIILPAILAISLFIISIFVVVVPTFKKNMMERKSEMIRELTNSAWSIFAEYEEEERLGRLSRDDAQNQAIARIQDLRYGDENKDYFWITDMEPRMIMHPYRPELNGTDLSGYKDPRGKKLFVEAVKRINDTII